MEKLDNQDCPFCHTKNLTLAEDLVEIPYFGKVFVFSMNCSNCKYNKSDLEAEERKPPCKYTLEITSEEDMKIRIVKSSEATVKIPRIASITPGPASDGFVSNVEGIFQRIKDQVEHAKEDADDPTEKKKCKKMIKKIKDIMWGHDKTKLVIEDPSGNSAIISEKAVKSKL